MSARAVIFGCSGTSLQPDERSFFTAAEPWGFILFARNIESPAQLRRLTSELRDAVGRDTPVLIDQEGGRVARMRGPAWREWLPALDACRELPSREERTRAMRLRYRLIAAELREVGIDVNCAPVLDLARPDTNQVILNRCYSGDPDEVAAVGRAVAEGLLDGGVLPVMKHMPGQGRAAIDSHLELPRVAASRAELADDFAPFRALADLPMAMTAHVVYAALDPDLPATQSPEVIGIVRREIGFDGLILTDDLSMKALRGGFDARAAAALAAGCDIVLHCNGNPEEMAAVASAAPALGGASRARADRALELRREVITDTAALDREWAEIGGPARA